MSLENLEQFRQTVLKDVALQAQLRAVMDYYSFIDLVVQAGEERGCHFTAEEVRTAMRNSRQRWVESWT